MYLVSGIRESVKDTGDLDYSVSACARMGIRPSCLVGGFVPNPSPDVSTINRKCHERPRVVQTDTVTLEALARDRIHISNLSREVQISPGPAGG